MRIKLDENYLNSIKSKIARNLNFNETIISRMNQGSNSLYVENLTETSRGKMVSRKNEIAIDKQFVNFNNQGQISGFNPSLKRLIESQLGHELLHAASRDNNYIGIVNHNINDNNRGLNEGITQMFTEDIFQYVVSPFTDGYKDYKKIAKIMRLCVGNEVFINSYFNHNDLLKNTCNNLAGNNYFFDEINKSITDLYYLRQNIKKRKDFSSNIIKTIYNNRIKVCFASVIINMVIPKIRTLKTEEEKKEFINNILKNVSDDKNIEMEVINLLKSELNMNPSQLEEEKRKVKLFEKTQKEKYKIINLMNHNTNSKPSFYLDENGNIFYCKNNEQNKYISLAKDEELCTIIYEYLYKYYFKPNFDFTKIIEENIKKERKITLPTKLNTKQKRILFCHIKKLAQQNDIIILNSYQECNHNNEIKINYINKDITFDDLKTLITNYDLHKNDKDSIISKLEIIDKKTNKKVNDPFICTNVRFAYLWLSTNQHYYENEIVPGFIDAFSETNKKIYNELISIMTKKFTDTGNLDLNYLYQYGKNHKNTRFLKVLQTILNTPHSYECVYRFIQEKTDKNALQIKLEKSYSELFYNNQYDEAMRNIATEEILSTKKK